MKFKTVSTVNPAKLHTAINIEHFSCTVYVKYQNVYSNVFFTQNTIIGNAKDAYLTPKNLGRSPGADVSLSRVSDRTWLMESTVAATNQGVPTSEHTAIWIAMSSKSKW